MGAHHARFAPKDKQLKRSSIDINRGATKIVTAEATDGVTLRPIERLAQRFSRRATDRRRDAERH